MAGFTLIHGAGQNASAWNAVANELRRRGHVVGVPDLPKNEPTWTLRAYADFIVAAMPAEAPRIAVASSFSGVFLPMLPADVMVFDAAVVPEPGVSVRAQFDADSSMFNPDWITNGVRWLDPAQHASLAREFLFHDLDDPTEALRTVEMFDTRHLVAEPSPIERLPPATYVSIVATGDRTITPGWLRRVTRERLGVEPIEIDAGHFPHTTRPAEFVAILEAILPRRRSTTRGSGPGGAAAG